MIYKQVTHHNTLVIYSMSKHYRMKNFRNQFWFYTKTLESRNGKNYAIFVVVSC